VGEDGLDLLAARRFDLRGLDSRQLDALVSGRVRLDLGEVENLAQGDDLAAETRGC
jgi:hypothetical protein